MNHILRFVQCQYKIAFDITSSVNFMHTFTVPLSKHSKNKENSYSRKIGLNDVQVWQQTRCGDVCKFYFILCFIFHVT